MGTPVGGKIHYIAVQNSIVQHPFYDRASFLYHLVYENLVMTLHPYYLCIEVQTEFEQ